MLRIRKEQMEVLGQMVLRQFERRVVAYLMQQYPEEAKRRGEEGLLALVRRSRDRARTYELDSEAAVVAWVELSLIYGEDFDTREPWACYILQEASLEPPEKLRRLQGYLAESPDA